MGEGPVLAVLTIVASKHGLRYALVGDVGVKRWLWWQQWGLPVPWVMAMRSIPKMPSYL